MNEVLVEVRAIPLIPHKKTQILRLRSGTEWMGHSAFAARLKLMQDTDEGSQLPFSGWIGTNP
jgi:hypothetical protein